MDWRVYIVVVASHIQDVLMRTPKVKLEVRRMEKG